MPEELKDIETSVIDRLLELKKQREVISDRLTKLDQEVESVSPGGCSG